MEQNKKLPHFVVFVSFFRKKIEFKIRLSFLFEETKKEANKLVKTSFFSDTALLFESKLESEKLAPRKENKFKWSSQKVLFDETQVIFWCWESKMFFLEFCKTLKQKATSRS
jgi:hypothetical protein